MIIREQLQQRNLPPLGVLAGPPQSPAAYESNRRNVKKLLCEHEYGFIPPAPIKVEAEVISVDARFCAGHAPLQRVMPVSYTHLDVYKRQHQSLSTAVFITLVMISG